MQFSVIGMNQLSHDEISIKMHKERRKVFVDRLGWNLTLNEYGMEVDEYDDINAIYIILMDDHGYQIGSARIRPTINGSMIQDHFSHMLKNSSINSDKIWELSRLFVTENAKPNQMISQTLMWAAARFALHIQIRSLASITTEAHIRWFSRFGWNPEVIGQGQTAEGLVSICLSNVNRSAVEAIERRCKIGQSMIASLTRSIELGGLDRFAQDEHRSESVNRAEISSAGGMSKSQVSRLRAEIDARARAAARQFG